MKWNVQLLCSCAVLALLQPKRSDAQARVDYLPLVVDNQWVYRDAKAPEKKTIVTCVRQETFKVKKLKGKEEVVQSVDAFRLSITYEIDGTAGDNELTESMGVTAEGIFRFAAGGKEIVPPLCLLKFPAPGDTKWPESWTSEGVSDKMLLKGNFKASGKTVVVPKGRFTAQVAECADFQAGAQKFGIEYSFAPNIGIVKQRLVLAGRETVLELETCRVKLPAP